ncbi:MAG TPA: nodulation protein NfeD [Bacillota bacterium]|nr:nodulation protein NfeD [Bacillota bacterium]
MFTLILLILQLPINSTAQNDGKGKLVYIIPVQYEVERGLEAFIDRSIQEAEENFADHVIFKIDTPGGRVDSASKIATLIQDINVPTTAYVVNQALSAGSYIALNADEIYMRTHATMGSSKVVQGDGSAADLKAQSAWAKAMQTAAESQGRDPIYAAAMVDETIDIPEAPEGELLTLTPSEAEKVGYAEGIVNNQEELLYELQLTDAKIVEMETTVSEEIARFITSPIVIPILLSIASLGLVLELYSPGFGVPGTMGLVGLGLFFYGHLIAGLAGLESVVLLVLGIGLIVAEFFLTSGILGILGAGTILGSLYVAGYDFKIMTYSIAIALIVALVVAVILFRSIGLQRGPFRRLVLQERTTTELGYVSNVNRLDLIGQKGITATALRPSGAAIINDERIDVVSESHFIDKNKSVEVVKVEGMRVVVREIT